MQTPNAAVAMGSVSLLLYLLLSVRAAYNDFVIDRARPE
jgi:hypothetical protein